MTEPLTFAQRIMLILLRTAIGWHFLYEGLYKLLLPAWTREGQPLSAWSAAGYLRGAEGPASGFFQRLAEPPIINWIDVLIPSGLVAIGVSLILGFFTTVGCWAAALFLALVYLAAVPTSGLPQPGSEGAYLLVSKTLIELIAVLVLIAFQTGRIAGLDLIVVRWRRPRRKTASPSAVDARAARVADKT
jgi:thiosulfate dehydrogenase [quinone] large subunit